MSSLADDFRALGLMPGETFKPTCKVCSQTLSQVLTLDDFDFDETPEAVGVKFGDVAACSACWRLTLTDMSAVLASLPSEVREGILENEDGMNDLIDKVLSTNRIKRIKEGGSP